MGRSPHSLAEVPVVKPDSILPPQVWTRDWNFLVATSSRH